MRVQSRRSLYHLCNVHPCSFIFENFITTSSISLINWLRKKIPLRALQKVMIQLLGLALTSSLGNDWVVLPDTDFSPDANINSTFLEFNSNSIHECAHFCLNNLTDCVAIVWNEHGDRRCNYKCGTHGQHIKKGKKALILRPNLLNRSLSTPLVASCPKPTVVWQPSWCVALACECLKGISSQKGSQ